MTEYIDREALIKSFRSCGASVELIDAIVYRINLQKPADVEPVKRGRWVHKIMFGEQTWFCSECKTIGSPQWKRCPVCEAKMDEEEKE